MDMTVICREVDKNSGKVAVYRVEGEVTDRLLYCLSIRAKMNPELRYFVTPKVRWDGACHDDIVTVLKRRSVTPQSINRLGGLVEL